ncbi:hypothetical protein SCYAM73S_07585 [Streptomyces cyaneofuscatus]
MTLYGAWSAEPSVCHFPLPTWAAKTTRLSCPPSTSAVISTVPVAPAAGAFSAIAGLAAGAPRGLSARSTMLERSGTVTVTFLSAPLRTAPEPPYSVRKLVPADSVVSWTFFGVAALLEATRYSYGRLASIREVAYTDPSAYRSLCAPSRSAGCSLVSFASPAMER